MTTIKLKNGSGAPTSGDLAQGEPALDLTNKRLYTEDSGGTVIEVGTNPGVDVTFADNRKAVFGAGSDLQIYHNGSNSYIDDAGTGGLVIRSSAVNIGKYTGETMAVFTADGSVQLRYDNSAKFETTNTGIDVTGTVTADALDVSNGNLKIESEVSTTPTNDSADYIFRASNTHPDYNGGDLILQARSSASRDIYMLTGTTTPVNRFKVDGGGDISFYEDTGTTAKLFWDASAESLGIGTTAPERTLHVDSAGVQIGALISSTSAVAARLSLMDANTTNSASVGIGATGDNLGLYAGGAARATLDSSGNLLVGTTTTTAGNEGMVYFNGSSLRVTRDSDEPLNLDRLSTDGAIAAFKKDGTTVGSISSRSGAVLTMILDPRTGGRGLSAGTDSIVPTDKDGTLSNGATDIGEQNFKFRDLYLSGGAYLGGTAAANLLDDYEEGTWTGAVADAASGGNESSTGVSGTYVKIGKIVYLQFNASNIDTTGMTSGSDIHITGLPFTAASLGGNAKFTGTAHLSVVTFGDSPFINLSESQTYVKLGENRPSAGVDFVVVSQLSSGASDIHGNLVYQTT